MYKVGHRNDNCKTVDFKLRRKLRFIPIIILLFWVVLRVEAKRDKTISFVRPYLFPLKIKEG